MGIFDREEEQASNEGMPEYETDASRVEDALQPGGGLFRSDDGQEVQQTEQEQLEELDVPEDEEPEEERTPDGRLIVELVYVGRRDQIATRYGTFKPERPFKLPENKALTVLGMKQPDNSPAFKRTSEL